MTIILVGDNTETGTTGVGPTTFGDIEFCSFVASTTGSATDGYFYTTQIGMAFVLAVYDASGNLLGSSNELSSSTSGWNHVTFSPAISIVSGTTYQLAICADDVSSGWQLGMGAAAGSPWHYYVPSSAFFPTPPSALTTTGAGTASNISVYLAAAGGAALAGTPTDATSASGMLATAMTLAQWDVGTVQTPQLQRRIFFDDGGVKYMPGGQTCLLHEIYPVTLGSGTLTIVDQNGTVIFSATAAQMPQGAAISVDVTGTGTLHVSSFPTGGEYGMSWKQSS